MVGPSPAERWYEDQRVRRQRWAAVTTAETERQMWLEHAARAATAVGASHKNLEGADAVARYVEQHVDIGTVEERAEVEIPGDFGLAVSLIAVVSAPRSSDPFCLHWHLQDSIDGKHWEIPWSTVDNSRRAFRANLESPQSSLRLMTPLGRKLRVRLELRRDYATDSPVVSAVLPGVALDLAYKLL